MEHDSALKCYKYFPHCVQTYRTFGFLDSAGLRLRGARSKWKMRSPMLRMSIVNDEGLPGVLGEQGNTMDFVVGTR